MKTNSYIALMVRGVVSFAFAAGAPTQPPQPETGPGGKDYPHAELVAHSYGEGDQEFWLFEPANPVPKSAPVIIFNHGWGAMNPNPYGAWIKHLVQRGNIVIYPVYQASRLTRMKEFLPNAIGAVKAAFSELEKPGHVAPELDHVAIVGHSMGAEMTPYIAALAAAEGLPVPSALCCVQPGGNADPEVPDNEMPRPDLSKIPATTLALVIVGDQDHIAGDGKAKLIYGGLKQIPAERKSYITLISDDHGMPALVGNHFAPVAMENIVPQQEKTGPIRELASKRMQPHSASALDYFGIWKLFDGLTDAAFYGKNGKYALGNTAEQKYMGKWSDGTPVKELKVEP